MQSDLVKIETPEFSPWNGRDQSPPLTGSQRLLSVGAGTGRGGTGMQEWGVEGQGCRNRGWRGRDVLVKKGW